MAWSNRSWTKTRSTVVVLPCGNFAETGAMDVARPVESGGNALEDPLGGMPRFRDVADMAQRHGCDACFTSAFNLNDTTGIPDCGAVETRCFGEQAARNVQLRERFDSEPLAEFAETAAAAISGTARCLELARLVGDCLVRDRSDKAYGEAFSCYPLHELPAEDAAGIRCRTAVPADDLPEGDFSEERQNEIASHLDVSLLAVRAQPVSSGRLGFLQCGPVRPARFHRHVVG